MFVFSNKPQKRDMNHDINRKPCLFIGAQIISICLHQLHAVWLCFFTTDLRPVIQSSKGIVGSGLYGNGVSNKLIGNMYTFTSCICYSNSGFSSHESLTKDTLLWFQPRLINHDKSAKKKANVGPNFAG